MKYETAEGLLAGAGISIVLAAILMVAGYVGNIVWMFKNMGTINGEFILAAIGVVVGPLGALHGIWSWF